MTEESKKKYDIYLKAYKEGKTSKECMKLSGMHSSQFYTIKSGGKKKKKKQALTTQLVEVTPTNPRLICLIGSADEIVSAMRGVL